MDEMIQEKVGQKENELNATYDERLRNYEERCVLPVPSMPLRAPDRQLSHKPIGNKTSNAKSH